jgi:hypothetical protein
VPDAWQHEADPVPVLEFLRQYGLREYAAVLAVALFGASGVVMFLNAAGGPAASGETIALKRETTRAGAPGSVRSVEVEAAAERRARERARALAHRREIQAMRAARAARRAAAAASARSRTARRTVVRATPRRAAAAPIRVVNTTPAPVSKPKPAPVSKPSPKPTTSGTGGGGGGSFDDSG